MFRNTQTSLRIRRPPLCLLTLVANADLTSESRERRLVSQPIGRVTAHNPVNCILVILTPSCEYPVDRGCRRSSARVKRLFTRSLLLARVLNSGPHDSQARPANQSAICVGGGSRGIIPEQAHCAGAAPGFCVALTTMPTAFHVPCVNGVCDQSHFVPYVLITGICIQRV